jgi:hypothetical protein
VIPDNFPQICDPAEIGRSLGRVPEGPAGKGVSDHPIVRHAVLQKSGRDEIDGGVTEHLAGEHQSFA